ncbi:hypothetical protein FTX61_11780 [Nitriliruptoraceae bacterium ZYF776]|nr:hypothetical protein [Profundirhabdus halotolerans]
MDIEVTAAIIGGALSGFVVFAALTLEHRLARRRERNQRRNELVSSVLGQFVAALHRNTSPHVGPQTKAMSLGELLSAQAQLLAFGGDRVLTALIAFENAPQHTGDHALRSAVVALFNAVREEVLDAEPLEPALIETLLFGSAAPGPPS